MPIHDPCAHIEEKHKPANAAELPRQTARGRKVIRQVDRLSLAHRMAEGSRRPGESSITRHQHLRLARIRRVVSNLGFDAAGTRETPAAQSLVNGEQSGDHKNQPQPQHEIHKDDAGNEAERTNDAAGEAALPFNVGAEELAHNKNLPHRFSVASSTKLRQITGVDLMHLDSNQLWASVLWGGIGGGYLLYGWRQKSSIPFVGGVVMSLACFLPALPMTLVSVATMAAVYWLMKQGY